MLLCTTIFKAMPAKKTRLVQSLKIDQFDEKKNRVIVFGSLDHRFEKMYWQLGHCTIENDIIQLDQKFKFCFEKNYAFAELMPVPIY